MKTIDDYCKKLLFVGDKVAFIHEPFYCIKPSIDGNNLEELRTNDEVLYHFNKMPKNTDNFPVKLGVVTETNSRGVYIREDKYNDMKYYRSSACGDGMITSCVENVVIFILWENVDTLMKEKQLARIADLKKENQNG